MSSSLARYLPEDVSTKIRNHEIDVKEGFELTI
jgi:hypothetical protein